MDMIKIITSFLVLALFVIAMVGFAVDFGNANGAQHIITDNHSAISTIYSGVNSTIYNYNDNGLQSTANESYTGFNDNSGTSGIASTISEFFINTILFVGKTIMGVSNAIFNVTFSPILKAIGIPDSIGRVIGGIVATIMLFTMILMGWKLYRVGY